MASPENNRIDSRKKKLNKIWRSAAWRKAVKEFTKGKVCSWCGGTTYLTGHHPYRNSYGNDTYIDLYLSGCIILCRSCHYAIHHSLILCPICKKHYMRLGASMCYGCFILEHPEVAEAIEIAKERRKRLRRELDKKRRLKAKEFKKSKSLGTKD
jgi:hypothetical protein